MFKKGALQLSINAIVVLILAITILGLGLAFITKMFGSTTEQLGAMTGEMKKDTLDKAASSGDLLYTDNAEYNLKRGKKANLYWAVTNTDSTDLTATLDFDCQSAMSGSCPSDMNDWVRTYDGVTIEPDEAAVFPIEITPQETGNFKVDVCVCDGGSTCSKGSGDYTTEEIFINVD